MPVRGQEGIQRVSAAKAAIEEGIAAGAIPDTALASPGFYRAVVIDLWKAKHLDMCEAIADLYNHGHRGAGLDLRAS